MSRLPQLAITQLSEPNSSDACVKLRLKAIHNTLMQMSCIVACYSGVYWVCASLKCTVVKEVYCDMRSGGWTLIGQIGNVRGNFQNEWLVTNKNTEILQTPVIRQGTYGWIDAVEMAVNHAKEVSCLS